MSSAPVARDLSSGLKGLRPSRPAVTTSPPPAVNATLWTAPWCSPEDAVQRREEERPDVTAETGRRLMDLW